MASIKFDMKNRAVFVKGLKQQLGNTTEKAFVYRKTVARAALKELVRLTPVWTGKTQRSIKLTDGRQGFRSNTGKATRAQRRAVPDQTNFKSRGSEANNRPGPVMAQLSNMKIVKDYRKFNNFYITVNSHAEKFGLYKGSIPNQGPQTPRVKEDVFAQMARMMRAKGRS